jgi:hypothetical protein
LCSYRAFLGSHGEDLLFRDKKHNFMCHKYLPIRSLMRPLYTIEVSIDSNCCATNCCFTDPVNKILAWNVAYMHLEGGGACLKIAPRLNPLEPMTASCYMVEVNAPQRQVPQINYLLKTIKPDETLFGYYEMDGPNPWFAEFTDGIIFVKDAPRDVGIYGVQINVLRVVARVTVPAGAYCTQ